MLWLPISAQAQEREKYNTIRTRLVRDFVQVGAKPGQSIPASRFYVRWDPNTKRFYRCLEFGDATIHLGWYLAVLATENYILSREGKNTEANLRELYYALHALERLDKVSDVAWSYGQQSLRENAIYDSISQEWVPKFPVNTQADGFFLRDDIPPYFATQFPNTDIIRSDFTVHQSPTVFTSYGLGSQESKDQLISVLLGLFFVHRFVGNEMTYESQNIKKYNKEITKRILDFVRYEKNNHVGNWKISNPGNDYKTPHFGYDPILFSYPLGILGDEIVHNKKFSTRAATQLLKERVRPTYQSQASILTKQVFLQLRESKVFLDKNYDWHINYYMINMLASLSNVWAYNLAYENNCVELLAARCSAHESKGWLIYPLINYALYPGETIPYTKAYVAAELALYPQEGSYNFFNTPGDSLGKYSSHWFSSNRFQSSNGHYEGNKDADCNSYFNGRYNGLDYMLLYNLYEICYILN